MAEIYLLDANVLYSYTLRDLFVTLGTLGVSIRWSDQIEAEFLAARIRKRPDHQPRVERTLELMRLAIPRYRAVASDRKISELNLPDPEDRHVLAAAIQAGAEVIVTANLRDFPPHALAFHGIEALTPDQALQALLDENPERMVEAITEVRGRMVEPPLSLEDWLDRLRKMGCHQTAGKLSLILAD